MKTLKYMKYGFSLAALLLLLGAFYSYTETRSFLSEAGFVEGEIIGFMPVRSDNSTTYAAVVRFVTQEGVVIEHVSSTSSNPPSFTAGDRVGVYYDQGFPEYAQIDSFFSLWGMAVVLAIIGGVMLTVVMAVVAFGALKGRNIRFLQANGVRIETRVQGIELNRSLVVNGRSPFQILSQWKDPVTDELRLFKSDNIWFDPSDHISSDHVSVLIEEGRPANYHMDISFLPKLAG